MTLLDERPVDVTVLDERPTSGVPGGTAAARLWRRRLIEAEAGLTRFIVDGRAGAQLNGLLETKRAIFAEIPDGHDEDEWKTAFFRAQALMEKFVVTHFGLDHLSSWAAMNSSVYAAVDAEPKHDATVPLQRLKNQAGLYRSAAQWVEQESGRAVLRIGHCAIWDYRELARRRGVELTLDAPCEYCVPATTAMITNKGLNADYELTEDETGHGCVWTASH
ncbi:hypothetical protein [Actinosynnema sp. NPDC023587]|uniref:hypothetical protein n=1 Tax=Actinosynnema sp. NPDC023587 TaxID=3154695 RepID=UPI0033F2FB90